MATDTQAPGTATTNIWGTKTSVSSTFPASCEIVFTDDLPNGPYGENNGMSTKLYVAPDSTYDVVAQAMLQQWIKMRGSMTQMVMKNPAGMGSSNYKEEWRIITIEYKGGPVEGSAVASEGPHNVTLGIIQQVGANPCCTIL